MNSIALSLTEYLLKSSKFAPPCNRGFTFGFGVNLMNKQAVIRDLSGNWFKSLKIPHPSTFLVMVRLDNNKTYTMKKNLYLQLSLWSLPFVTLWSKVW